MPRSRTAHVTALALLASSIALVAPGARAETPAPAPAGPGSPGTRAPSPEAASYAMGLVLGGQIHQSGLTDTVHFDALIQGLKAGAAGAVATNEQRAEANQFLRAGREALGERNRAQARAFLEKNATAAGVRTTPTGLQYRVIHDGRPGSKPPAAGDQVSLRYRAAFADGTEFDSSDAHGATATVRVANVIRGWREALLMMSPGAKWQLFVPPDLAYGNSPPPSIPPGALLVYELELLGIEPQSQVDANAMRERGTRSKPAAAPPGAAAPPK